MLRKMIEKGYCSVHEGFENWEEAVRASVQPLVQTGAVEAAYADSIVNCVKKFGPYIVIAPNIAIPHAEDPAHVNETAVCFMKSNRPVAFGEETDQQVQLFFALASNDEALHLENLRALMGLLCDEKLMEQLAQVRTREELLELVQ